MGVYTERYFAGSSYEAVATVRQWYIIKSVLRGKENVCWGSIRYVVQGECAAMVRSQECCVVK